MQLRRLHRLKAGPGLGFGLDLEVYGLNYITAFHP